MSTISASTTTTTAYKVTADTTGTLVLQTGSTPTTAVTIDTSQNVGIGTASPLTRVEAVQTSAGAVTTAATLRNSGSTVSGTGVNLFFSTVADNARGAYVGALSTDTSNSNALVFGTNTAGSAPVERARIDSSGNLLVGATSTFGNGPVQVASATSGQISVRHTAATAGAHWRIGPDSSANDLIVYSSSTGGVYITNTGTSWVGRSDERLKDIIEPIANAADKVSSLRAVIGKFKTDEEGTRRSFLIAQDVQAVLPEAVSVAPRKENEQEDYLGVSYTDVIPLLVAAIKEQQAIIETLTNRITALEGAA